MFRPGTQAAFDVLVPSPLTGAGVFGALGPADVASGMISKICASDRWRVGDDVATLRLRGVDEPGVTDAIVCRPWTRTFGGGVSDMGLT